jgi:hypothetical protein
MLCLQMMIHMSDLSNPTKPWKITSLWTGLIYWEFFAQGDMEREAGLPLGMLNDRETINIAKSQLNFIGFIIQSAYESFANFLPKV